MYKASEFKQKDNLRSTVIYNCKQILERNPDIKIEEVTAVGILESGNLQFKIPKSIKNRQIIILLGYLKWFWEINDEELK